MVQTPVSNQSTAWLRLVGALLVRVNLSTSPEEISCENGTLRCSAEQVSSISTWPNLKPFGPCDVAMSYTGYAKAGKPAAKIVQK